jgi:PUA domain protein
LSSIRAVGGKERKNLIKQATNLVENVEEILPKKGLFRHYISKRETVIVGSDKIVLFIDLNGKLIPSLKIARKIKLTIPKIIVDLGAVKFVTNGADIMRPGITKISDDVLEGSMVLVTEEKKDSPLCFGIALYDAVDMRNMKGGKCIKNLHYLTDQWWNFTP